MIIAFRLNPLTEPGGRKKALAKTMSKNRIVMKRERKEMVTSYGHGIFCVRYSA